MSHEKKDELQNKQKMMICNYKKYHDYRRILFKLQLIPSNFCTKFIFVHEKLS